MSPLFCAFLALVATRAATDPWIGPSERMLAATAIGLLFALPRLRGAVVCGALLALAGAAQLHAERRAAERWAGREVVARLLFEEGSAPASHTARAAALDLPPIRLQFVGENSLARTRSCRSAVARIAVEVLPQRRNPDDRHPGRSRLARGPLLRARVLECEALEERGPAGHRDRLLADLDRRLGGSAALWRALLLGDRGQLHDESRERVRRLGLSHLLALSGLHVGGMLALLALVHPRRQVPLWALVPLAAWIALAGAGASLMRAGWMAGWWLFARRWQRRVAAADALAFAGFVDLCATPRHTADVGWWLSYAATYALMRSASARPRGRIRSALLLSSAAALATAPWALAVFGQFVWSAPAGNLLAGAPFALLMGAGVCLALLGAFVPPLQAGCDVWIQLLSHGFGALLAVLERLMPDPVGHPGLHGGWWGTALVLWVFALLPRPRGRLRAGIVVSVVISLHFPLLLRPSMRWWTLDVGQGDAGALREGGSWLLVDSGPQFSERSPATSVVLPFLRRRNVRDAGYAITHGHLDHMGGARELLRSGRIGRLYLAASDSTRAWTNDLRAICSSEGVRLIWLARGDTLRHGRLRLPVLWPPAHGAPAHANDRSLVLIAGTGSQRLLLCGDLERSGESSLLATGMPRVRVLKLAHHGGDTGSDLPWLRRLQPDYALISCGRGNRYGHPHPDVLDRLQRSGIVYGRTDRDGYLEIRWIGGEMRLLGGWP